MSSVATAGSRIRPLGSGRRRAELSANLLKLRFRAFYSALFSSSPAVILAWLYVFFEYVRPQQIYTTIDVLPWAKITLLGAVVFAAFEGRLSTTASALALSFTAFSAVVFSSLLTAQYPSISLDGIDVWINWVLMVIAVGIATKSRREFVLVVLGFVLWNLKMSQHGARSWIMAGFRFRSWGIAGPPGWFTNSGEFAIEMCVFLPVFGYLAYGLWPELTKWKRWACIAVVASVLLSIIGSSSRGALVGGAAIGLWILIRSPQRMRAVPLVIGAAALTWLILPPESKARWTKAGDDNTSTSRLTYWKDGVEIANRYPLTGIGYKNWIRYYRTNYNPEGELPHNYLIECVAELGYPGLVAFLLMTSTFFYENHRSRKRIKLLTGAEQRLLLAMSHGVDGAMIGFLASGFFVTVLYYPYYWFNLSLALGLSHASTSLRKSQGA